MVKAEFKEVQFTVDGHEVAVGHLVVEQPKPMSTDPNEVRYWGFLEDLAKLEGGKEVAFEVGSNVCYLRKDGVAINDGSIKVHANEVGHVAKHTVYIWV